MLTDAAKELPDSINNILKKIVSDLNPEKIVLFGSRARKTHRENSDVDIACYFNNKNQEKWTRFLVELNEKPWSLWPIDLVDYSELSDDYKNSIDKEGQVLYERKT